MQKTRLTLLLYLFAHTIYGQYQIGIIPRESPDKAIYQKIGYTEVEIKYGSPSVKNRNLWGELVPYDKVWRAGANNATTIKFSSDVTIDNVTLNSGIYSLFLIPKKNDKWTVVFNKVSKQWGAFKYNVAEDILRLDISPKWTKLKTEKLTYTINQTSYQYGSIIFLWDFIELEIPFETNYLSDFEKEVESRANTQPEYIKWIPYIQGAEHLEELNANLDLAFKWINKAEKIMNSTTKWNEQFYKREYVKAHLFWIKAKILAKNKDFKAAIQYVDKLKNLDNTIFYDKKNDVENIDILYGLWKSK